MGIAVNIRRSFVHPTHVKMVAFANSTKTVPVVYVLLNLSETDVKVQLSSWKKIFQGPFLRTLVYLFILIHCLLYF